MEQGNCLHLHQGMYGAALGAEEGDFGDELIASRHDRASEVIDDDREVLNMLGKWEIVTCVNLSQNCLIGRLERAHGHDDLLLMGGAPFAERNALPNPGGCP